MAVSVLPALLVAVAHDPASALMGSGDEMRFRRKLSRVQDLERTVEVAADALEMPYVSDETRVKMGLAVLRTAMRRLNIVRRKENASVER